MNKFNLNKFLNENKKNIKKIFPERKIISIYFDTLDLMLFNDSINKDYDKYKIRFRKYDDSNIISKEIKFSEKDGKYKIVTPTDYTNFKEIKNFYFKGNLLGPSLKVEYIRNYYEYKGNRLTIDSDVIFSKPSNRSNIYKLFDVYVFELKNLDKNQKNFFPTNPIFNAIKFSKYEEGIKKIYI